MRILLLAASLIAYCPESGAGPHNSAELELFTSRNELGLFSYAITNDRADKLPRWNPAESEPPLKLSDAIAKAREWVASKNPEVPALELDHMVLNSRQNPHVRGPEVWYYEISFDPKLGGRRGSLPGLSAVVLMDGSIVEASPE